MPKEQEKNSETSSTIELRERLLKSKIEFSEKAMQECLTFLALDNKIISHFEEILDAVKEDIKKNPDKFYANSNINSKHLEMDLNKGFNPFDPAGIVDLIKDVIVKDKELVASIIREIFGL